MSTATEAQQHKHPQHEKKHFDITVIFNGAPKEIKVRLDDTVQTVLERVVKAFRPPAPDTMALFDRTGEELDASLTVDQAGIREGDKLLLQPSKKPFPVSVIYNGVAKQITVRHEELVSQVLERAVAAFQPLPAPHTMSLFNEAGQELNDAQTVDQAGIHPRDKLLLRPSAVKGG